MRRGTAATSDGDGTGEGIGVGTGVDTGVGRGVGLLVGDGAVAGGVTWADGPIGPQAPVRSAMRINAERPEFVICHVTRMTPETL